MVDVAIIGVGQTSYGLFPERSLKALFCEAVREAFADVQRGLDPGLIDEAYIGSLSTGGSQLGNFAPLMLENAGLAGVAGRHVENACASSGYAFRDACFAVASGRRQVVLAAGVEKMSDLPRQRNRQWLGVSGDVEWERLAGTNFPGIYAMCARRHMYEYGTTKAQITGVAVKARANAALNPKAQIRSPITLEKALATPNLAAPFVLSDACNITDGASAVILCDAKIARDFTDKAVTVVGSGAASDYVAIHDRDTVSSFKAARQASQQAYQQAGIAPSEVSLAEVHDCFSIGEILAYGDCGFCAPEQAGSFLEEGRTAIGGDIPVNASGGLIGKGHPIGATGTGQIYELVKQLRGEADDAQRQVQNASIGLAHNVGGSGGCVVVHLFRAPV